MKKSIYRVLVASQILCLFLLAPTMLAQGYAVKKIVIDAGHGGKDPGCIGSKCKEKDIALKVALLTGQYIEKYLDDVEVIYTRDKDVYPTLNERAQIANNANADLFISIHCNAVASPKAYGAETFVLGTAKSDANKSVAQKENAVITFEENYEETYKGFDNSPPSYIIFNFVQNAYIKQSTLLASLIQNQYTKRVGRHDREVKQDNFWVLWATSMPAILTELGFLSNPDEQRFLMSQEGQEYMASAIFRAVRDYKKEIESKQSLTLTDAEKAMLTDSINTKAPASSTGPSHFGVSYKLQIFSSSEILPLDHPSIKGLKEVDYYVDGDSYKYTIGYSSDMDEIKKLKKEYKKQFEGCFIAAFNNGKRISMDEARQLKAE